MKRYHVYGFKTLKLLKCLYGPVSFTDSTQNYNDFFMEKDHNDKMHMVP